MQVLSGGFSVLSFFRGYSLPALINEREKVCQLIIFFARLILYRFMYVVMRVQHIPWPRLHTSEGLMSGAITIVSKTLHFGFSCC